jgi:hypothetical protein
MIDVIGYDMGMAASPQLVVIVLNNLKVEKHVIDAKKCERMRNEHGERPWESLKSNLAHT